MTTDLPDLSTWHPVPVGAPVHRGTRVAEECPDGSIIIERAGYNFTQQEGSNPRYTETPIREPLPTDEGAQIIAGVDTPDTPWRVIWRLSSGLAVRQGRITRWAPAPSEWRER